MSATIPDVKGAFIAWAKGQPTITAICPVARIRGNLPTAEFMPGFYLTATKAGGFGSAVWVPLDQPRLDIWCYGPTGYEAHRLWRAMHAALIPPARMQGGIIGFDAAHTRVLDVQNEGSAREDNTPEGWPYVWVSYVFTIMEIALP